MEIKEALIREEFGSVQAFLKHHGFTRNSYESLKRKTTDYYMNGTSSKSFQLKELLKRKNLLKVEENSCN